MTNAYRDFLLMYLILDLFNDDNPNENVIAYLSDANPYMRRGEYSLDIVVFREFKEKYDKFDNQEEYSYEFLKEYLKNLDYYVGVYELFLTITKEEYLRYCEEVLTKQRELLKEDFL